MNTCLTSTARGTVILLAAALLGLLLSSAVPVTATERSETTEPSGLDWLSRMERFFAENPHLEHERSSGWKPYNRIKWALQRRMVNGRLPAPGARWEAWQVKRERERAVVPRSGWFEIGPVNMSGRILDIESENLQPVKFLLIDTVRRLHKRREQAHH